MEPLADVDKLRSRHATLDQAIRDESKRPLPDTTAITALKREKLRLKEEIQQVSQ